MNRRGLSGEDRSGLGTVGERRPGTVRARRQPTDPAWDTIRAEGRVDTRVEYGLGDFGGRPYGRFHVADGGARAFGTGMTYSITRVLDLRFEGTRTETRQTVRPATDSR